MKKIDIILITGFLGSGKTTLLNRLIQTIKNKQIGIIVNDFGRITVDADLIREKNTLENPERQIVEIANGSIFCSCLESVFIDGLKHYTENPPEILLIETSGLSDPSSMENIIKKVPGLDEGYNIRSVICIVNAVSFHKVVDTAAAVKKQLKAATRILINKTDLVGKEQIAAVREKIGAINRTAGIEETVHAEIEDGWLEKETAAPPIGSQESCNTPQSRPCSVMIPQVRTAREETEAILHSVKDKILRVKGFIKLGDESFLINDNNGEIELIKTGPRNDFHYGLSFLFENSHKDYVVEQLKKLQAARN